jgi:Metallo-beta-lactamase superfamily
MQMILSAIANLQVNPLRSSRAVVEGARTARDLAPELQCGQLPLESLAPGRDVLSNRCAIAPLSTGQARLAAKLSAVDDSREFFIDPGAYAETILNATAGLDISAFLLTHTHFDHVMAVPELVTELRSLVYAHQAETQVWRHEAGRQPCQNSRTGSELVFSAVIRLLSGTR